MSIVEQLDGVRNTVPGCQVVALADLSSGLILLVSSAHRQPQETLDQLCALAAELLDGPTAPLVSDALMADSPIDIGVGIALESGMTKTFQRSASDPAEVLCCIGSADVDPDALLAKSRELLKLIADLD